MKPTLLILLLSFQLHAGSHERAQQFFLCHYEAAEQLYFCHGIPIELSLSVWALESGYGTSKAAQVNNLGGIKSYKGGKKHNKTFGTLHDFYTSFAAIFDKPCYRNDMQPKTVKEYLRAMEYSCCSYHHSSEYTRKINWIIKRYKLDEMEVNNPEAEIEANNKGFAIGDTIVHNNDNSFVGNITGFLYNHKGVLFVTINYNGSFKFKDSYNLKSWKKLFL